MGNETQQSEISWSFYQIWNKSLEEGKNDKVLQPRQNMWATELGGAFIDRYLKMKAVPYTNPPNPRSLRKFEAGNIWESIIAYVLNRAGILITTQDWLSYQYKGLLQVTGKLDFIAGGSPDYEKATSIISSEFKWLPQFISRAISQIVIHLKQEYPNGLKNIILEIKSCSSFMFENYERKDEGNPNHKLQLFHYLKAKDMKEGHLVYISKDDARILEFGIFNPSPLETKYKKDIEMMNYYLVNNEQPPKEKAIVFDDLLGKFSANYKVGYSNYLTMLYGLENQHAFDTIYKPKVERWNRVLGRIKEGKNITANNKEALEEMKKAGFNSEELLNEH